jgi:hypothetical protein
VEFLRSQDRSSVKIASIDVLTRTAFIPVIAFHPKLYLFKKVPGVNAITGSANLTVQALTTNQEAVVLQKDAPQALWLAAWDSLTAGAVEFTPAVLAQYRQIRADHTPLAFDPPLPPLPGLGPLPIFWDEVQADRLDPSAFGRLWLDAGSMSSSESHNQLELPRGANRFFGFAFSQYDSSQTPIGYPPIAIRGVRFVDRKLAWHGDNRMERIYLATRIRPV